MFNLNSFLDSENKPEDWPVNAREAKLEAVYRAVEQYKDNPNYKNKEVLLALLNEHDLNQRSYLGEVRVSDYEAQLTNILYLMGAMYNINSLKTLIYEIVGDTTRFQKMQSWVGELAGERISIDIPAYDGFLLPPLKLYHYAYQKYNLDKDKDFSEKIIDLVNELLAYDDSEEMLMSVTTALIKMLYDLSCAHGTKKTAIWRFSREDLSKLFHLENELIIRTKQIPTERPLKGLLMMQISNFILKSRNDYNEDSICKYISRNAAQKGITNHQLWMKKTSLLNDKREERVVPELFKEAGWIPYTWAQNIDFTETRTYYVTSFCKEIDNEEMKKDYGECLYGYKDDRVAELIAPVYMQELERRKEADDRLPKTVIRPFLSQVIAFDILYDRAQAKEELIFLMNVINEFCIPDDDKKSFLQEIMQYWILSVKDQDPWEKEKERRYVLFLYDDYRYEEIEKDDTFLKVKTTLFLLPDFILGDNPVKNQIRQFVDEKRLAVSWKEYLFCENCLNRDFDAILDEHRFTCPICGSKKIKRIKPK